MWKLIRAHFETYKEGIEFKPTKVNVSTSISMTLLGFAITVFCYEKVSKKKSELEFSITTYKKFNSTNREYLSLKDFEKLMKSLVKQEYVFYIHSKEKLSNGDFTDHSVTFNLNKKLDYFITEDLAKEIKLKGIDLDSSKKTMPKFIYGVSKKGKLKCLYKANTKICKADKYWIAKKG